MNYLFFYIVIVYCTVINQLFDYNSNVHLMQSRDGLTENILKTVLKLNND